MAHPEQKKKAERFLELHQDPKLLILTNIWDPLGARLLVRLGYPAVATASAAVAYSFGYDDGEKIGFSTMLSVIRRIASSVDVPVSADIEGGYAEQPADVADNIREVIRAGAAGINIEDSTREGGPLRSVDFQCERIRAVRRVADTEGIPLVINARTDVFLSEGDDSKTARVKETIRRAKAYVDAGADCVYPITVGDIDTLRIILEAVAAPINVYASQKTAPMKQLEDAGISRLSVGPGLLKASLTTIKRVAMDLKAYGSYESFTRDVISNEEILRCVSQEKMAD
jgi:2-methylisocitrate lyase-like PEP mutase family enzyme